MARDVKWNRNVREALQKQVEMWRIGAVSGAKGTIYMLAAEADLLKEWLVDVDQVKEPEETSYSWLT